MTKKLGLLGGTSYPSTVYYYRRLNELYQTRQGGYHSCPLVLHNIDYHAIKSRYHHGWEEIPQLLKAEVEQLLAYQPDFLVLCNNTLHKALDIIRPELGLSIPVAHILELTQAYVQAQGMQQVLLLGTRFTMEDGFFSDALREVGVSVIIPNKAERARIQEIQSAVSGGQMADEYVSYFRQIAETYTHCDGIILGCTEFPLIFEQMEVDTPLVNTIELQCQFAVDFLLS
ncbi:MAG TPA: aspartate racemase [Cytophagales bacterium]|nr:aspartate racemase [Cytophagales bacterium]HAP64942.1 aspartate racemase [Cytophagales bacterium]